MRRPAGPADGRARAPLFYFLSNQAKLAIVNDDLSAQARFLLRGMRNEHILHFVLAKLVPAVVAAVVQEATLFLPLLDVLSLVELIVRNVLCEMQRHRHPR